MTPWEGVALAASHVLTLELAGMLAGHEGEHQTGGCVGADGWVEYGPTGIKAGHRRGADEVRVTWSQARRLLLGRLDPDEVAHVADLWRAWRDQHAAYCALLTPDYYHRDPDEPGYAQQREAITDAQNVSWEAQSRAARALRDAVSRTNAPGPDPDLYGTPSLLEGLTA